MEDQADLGSCSAEAITNAYEIQVKYQYPDKFSELSRLFLYYNSRFLENNVNEDAGVFRLRNAFQAIKIWGLCSETCWPFDTSKFNVQPDASCYQEAKKRSIISYEFVPSIMGMVEILNQNQPVVIGIEIFYDFLKVNQDNPEVKMPGENEISLGGHAMCVTGYSLAKQAFYVKNSFGTNWAESGFCWIPFVYIQEYSFERWKFDITDQVTEITLPSDQ